METITFNKSCAACVAWQPVLTMTDPETLKPIGLQGDCGMRGTMLGCPASNIEGIHVGDIGPVDANNRADVVMDMMDIIDMGMPGMN
jgi:hypothetical protein